MGLKFHGPALVSVTHATVTYRKVALWLLDPCGLSQAIPTIRGKVSIWHMIKPLISDHLRRPGMFETWREAGAKLGFALYCSIVVVFLAWVLVQALRWGFGG